jgi:DNA-binding SARP family transcriptional activator
LESQYEEMQLKLARYFQAAGLLEKAESTLERLLDFNNLSENGWQTLLQLYLAEKDVFSKTAYLNAYERYSKMLERELGLEPEERFQKQYREML